MKSPPEFNQRKSPELPEVVHYSIETYLLRRELLRHYDTGIAQDRSGWGTKLKQIYNGFLDVITSERDDFYSLLVKLCLDGEWYEFEEHFGIWFKGQPTTAIDPLQIHLYVEQVEGFARGVGLSASWAPGSINAALATYYPARSGETERHPVLVRDPDLTRANWPHGRLVKEVDLTIVAAFLNFAGGKDPRWPVLPIPNRIKLEFPGDLILLPLGYNPTIESRKAFLENVVREATKEAESIEALYEASGWKRSYVTPTMDRNVRWLFERLALRLNPIKKMRLLALGQESAENVNLYQQRKEGFEFTYRDATSKLAKRLGIKLPRGAPKKQMRKITDS